MGLSPWHLVYSYVQVVNTVCKKMLSEYWEKTKHGKPNHVYEFCDGSAAQFKGAPSFADIADSETELGYSRTRFYFERSHAKGPQDAAGANLKNAVTKAVLDNNSKHYDKVRDAKGLYDCAVDLEDNRAYAFECDKVRV